MDRRILHVDMDEFFAAVEKLDRPELRGKPLLIGGDPKARGVVSTASYEARRFGCHSAMPMATAVRLCPQAIVLPVRGRRYRELSEAVFAIFERFTPLIEPLSIDEAFLDVTGSRRLLGPAEGIAATIKAAIRDELGLTASVGVAFNKFLAKLASDLDKPDGLVVVTAENVRAILDPLPIERLWGVGPASAKQFERLGIATFGQLRQADGAWLRSVLGDSAEHYQRLARGQDDRPVTPDSQAKSLGQEETFARDIGEVDTLRWVLLGQVEHVARRLRRHGLRARTVTLKLRDGTFVTRTRSATLEAPTDVTDELWRQAEGLLMAWARRERCALRLLGFTASGLSAGGGQMMLFEDPQRPRLRRLDAALDRIAQRFGEGAVRRGPGPRRPETPSPEP